MKTKIPGSEGLTITNERNNVGMVYLIVRDAITSKPLMTAKPALFLAAPKLLAALKAMEDQFGASASLLRGQAGVDAAMMARAAILSAEAK